MSEPRIFLPRDPDEAGQALMQGLASSPDDFEHPEHELLAAMVDGSLDEADREWVEGHLEFCLICKEDVADLAGIRAELADVRSAPQARRLGWLKPAVGVGAVAAAAVLMVWWGGLKAPAPSGPVVEAPTAVAENLPAPAPTAETVLTDNEEVAVARALESGRVVFPDNIRLLRGQSGTLLGAPNADVSEAASPSPTMPVGIATGSPRPTFRWRTVPGATGYTVAVFDERFRKVAESATVSEAAWTPTSDLPRGRMLAWQVTAHLPGADVVSPAPPQPEARFIVLTRAEAADLAEQRERLSSEPIALGLALSRLGLFDEADAVFRQALNDVRFNQAQVQALLSNLEQRGR